MDIYDFKEDPEISQVDMDMAVTKDLQDLADPNNPCPGGPPGGYPNGGPQGSGRWTGKGEPAGPDHQVTLDDPDWGFGGPCGATPWYTMATGRQLRL